MTSLNLRCRERGENRFLPLPSSLFSAQKRQAGLGDSVLIWVKTSLTRMVAIANEVTHHDVAASDTDPSSEG